MLNATEYAEIVLLAQHGLSGREISAIVGRHRSTVAKALRLRTPPVCAPRKRKKKIDPFRASAARALTVDGLNSREVLSELGRLGFTGTLRNVQRFARELRLREFQRTNPGVIVPCAGSVLTAGHFWMLRLMQGKIGAATLAADCHLEVEAARTFSAQIREGHRNRRNRSIAVASHLRGVPLRAIAALLQVSRATVRGYVDRFKRGGICALFDRVSRSTRKVENPEYQDAVFQALHAPPATFGFNRTTWKMDDLKSALARKGVTLSRGAIRQIIRAAGYNFRKAKKVLTSNDPKYRQKLRAITAILRNLKPDESFFSIDEFGPLAIKIRGGRSLVRADQIRTVPMRQRSKGRLICTAALELVTNQVTHFYSEKKNTDEMLRLLDVLLARYSTQARLFLSWDAASWHMSARLRRTVRAINWAADQNEHVGPRVVLAPLPACAQFLNVIESVFSGMARAIIHNSDYPSVDACKNAIDRYFADRNQHFRNHPKPAGKKLWGKELVPPFFAETQNCKDPHYR